jgi:hypothetical protein
VGRRGSALAGVSGLDGPGVDAAFQAVVERIGAGAVQFRVVFPAFALPLLLVRRVARGVVLLLLRGAGLALLVLLVGLPALVVRRLLLKTVALVVLAHGGHSLIAPEVSGGEINEVNGQAFLSRKTDKS